MNVNWNNIQLMVSDFDGVMTDNRVLVDENGKESVFVSRADGQAIHILRDMGIDLVIMSTEINGVVAKRAEKLKVECIQCLSDKAQQLKKYSDDRNISLENIAYIGNDINDYNAMKLAGIKIVPNDAYEVVKDIADYVTEAKGGYGVIREIAEIIKNVKQEVLGGCKNGKTRD
jgi:YrbI family 3-deoxy-D-manno-octulosonate 8-phosphate phosphatase